MRAGRICLISPGHLSTNPRLVKEGRALTDAGYDVRVVCGRFAPWAREHDAELIDSRWQVSYVPFGPLEASPPAYLLQTVRRRLARVLVRIGSRSDCAIYTAHAPAAPGLCAAARSISADLYIAHYVAALPAAALAARRHGACYAFDAEDFHLGDLPDIPENAMEKRIVRDVEGRYLPGAAYVTAASPLIADAYADSYGISRPTTVLNVFPRKSAPAQYSPHGSAAPGPSLYWFSQTIGPGRGLETAIEAVACASSSPHLYVRGTPASGYVSRLRILAAHYGVADRLHLLPPAAPSEMERLGAQYDLGLSAETGFSRNNTLALGNKIFSYLCSGIPILASDIPAHKAIAADLHEAMTLFPTHDAAALAVAIDTLLLNPIQLAKIRECAWRWAQERYCWEIERRVFLDAVEGVMKPKPANA